MSFQKKPNGWKDAHSSHPAEASLLPLFNTFASKFFAKDKHKFKFGSETDPPLQLGR